MTVIDIIQDGIIHPLKYLLDPSRRICIVYLLSALLIAFFVLRYKLGLNFKSSLRYIFNRQVWFGKSAITDYLLFILGGIIKVAWVIPYLFLGTSLAFYLASFYEKIFGMSHINISFVTIAICYTIVLFLVKDFFVFVTHYLLHKSKYLWEFHKVHHSATTMTPFTLYRMHPVEIILQNLQGLLAFGLATSIFYYMSPTSLCYTTIMGVNIFSFYFFILGANLRHSNIPFSYPRFLEYIFMSPYQHQIHHHNQAKYCHSNFGSRLAIWDYIFKTHNFSSDLEHSKLIFGLPDEGLKNGGMYKTNNFCGNLISPFIGCNKILRKRK